MSYKTYEVWVYENGTSLWYLNGVCHREDGPAIEYANGHREWWLNGKRHRVDGPAVEWAGGHREWYWNGKQLTEEEWLKATNPVKELTVKEVEKLLGHPVKIVK